MFGAVAAAALCWGCGSAASSLPERVAVPFETVCPQADGTPVFIGGYGSAMGYDAADSCFWLLTDRGPNVDGPTPESKVFALPEFAPRVGKFRLSGDSLEAVGTVPLRDAAGNLFSGLPAAGGDGSTGEVGYDLVGEAVCDSLRRGLDTEGLALAGDGTFWVSDEYGPYLLRFDGEGRLLEEYSPFNGGLPEVLARRRPNRGMEGLAYDAGADMLFGIMQSPLYNPDASTKDTAVFCRIVALRPTDGRTAQYLYPLEDPGNVVSELCVLGGGDLLVLERDAEFPAEGRGFKKVFRIDLSQASDISPLDGYMAVDTLAPGRLAGYGLRAVEKELFCDILAAAPGYPHDKPEGMCLLGDGTLCVVNDDDFGINAPEVLDGRIVPKRIPGISDRDIGEIWFVAPALRTM